MDVRFPGIARFCADQDGQRRVRVMTEIVRVRDGTDGDTVNPAKGVRAERVDNRCIARRTELDNWIEINRTRARDEDALVCEVHFHAAIEL